jgi:hypothetical protein
VVRLCHCYWRLDREQEPAEIESLNRRLCHLIGGDPACTDRGRIMRLPASLLRGGPWGRELRGEAFWAVRRLVEVATSPAGGRRGRSSR